MDTAAIYCRLSKEDKSDSMKNQVSMLTAYAEEKGFLIYEIYQDDDYSGTDRSRPGFNKMIQDARNKKFNIILAKTQSRFTREAKLADEYLHTLFPAWGIRFIGVSDHVDTAIESNKKVRQIYRTHE